MKNWVQWLIITLLILFGLLKIYNTFLSPNNQKEFLQAEERLDLPADFLLFYEKFHRDSAFQLQHIRFPLPGLPSMSDPDNFKQSGFFYEKDSWKLHRSFDPEAKGYTHDFTMVSKDYLIIEKIREKETGIGLERRFVKQDGEWMLIYYAAMNKMKANE
jgi:hypothetical protein